MTELFLICMAFVASTTAAMVGLGGGILLISVMPGLIPPFAIIPVHGMVQVASNLTRVLFGLRYVVWAVILPFIIGGLLGAGLGSQILVDIRWDFLPLIIGCFILIITWAPSFRNAPNLPGKYGILGALQTFLSLFVGVVGPLNMPFLLREGFSRDRVVVTHATQMTALHTIKVATFVFLGFTFAPYAYLIAGMILSATLGSYVGTHWRSRVPEARFRTILKWIITMLALRMLLGVGL
jgi:uncharacterized membrane protein YfcA